LPDCGRPEDLDDRFKQYKYFESEMFDAKVFAAIVSELDHCAIALMS
jgi:hypothetical protein